MRAGWIAVAAAVLTSCQESHSRVLIGGTLANPGAAPIADSIVVIAGGKIRAAGLRRAVPVPQDSERVDVSGKFLTPAAGGTIASGEPASFDVRAGSASGAVTRSMKNGEWQ